MRRGTLLALLVLAACSTPDGEERPGCGLAWRGAEVVVTMPGSEDERPIPIGCMHDVGVRRIRIGFTLPGGPDCLQLARVDLAESADVVAVTLVGTPSGEACPDEDTIAVTEVDLAAPVGDRVLLDAGSQD